VAEVSDASAVASPSGPPKPRQVSRQLPRRELPIWPLWFFFGGFPVMWVLGLGGFATQIASLPMLACMGTRGRLRAPRGFGFWVLYLVWMLVTAVEVSGSARLIGFAYRATLYLAGTIAFLYVFNSSPRKLPLTRLCTMAATFLAFVVVGGYLGVVAPHGSIHTPFEDLLPPSFVHNNLVNKLVQPPFAQVSNSTYFHLAPRPAAPFPYTNDWGMNFALLVPFVLALLAATHRFRTRVLMIGLLTLALVPALLTLNRGMILGLGVGMSYAAVRFALRGHGKALFILVFAVALGVGLMATLHFGSRLEGRLSQSQSTGTRESVYNATFSEVKHSPILGYGAPGSSTVSTTGPDLGTQGQLWTVLYSAGFPGAIFFVVALVGFAWRTRKPRTQAMMWMHVVPVIAIVVLPIYRLEASELVLVMVAVAIAMRDRLIVPKRSLPMPTRQNTELVRVAR
jgi:polysaccharide biosynthesis protein PslJ